MSNQNPEPGEERPGAAPPPGWSPQQPPAWPGAGQQGGWPGQPGQSGPPGQYGPGPYGQPGQPSPYGQPGQQAPYGQPGPGQPGQYGPPGQPWGWSGPPPAYGQAPWGPGPQYGRQGGWGAPPPAPKPGIVPLRPLGLGDLLEGAFGLIRSNPGTVLGLAAAFSAASALIQMIATLSTYRVIDSSGILDTTSGQEVDLREALDVLTTTVATQLVPGLIAGFLQLVASGLFIVLVAGAVLGRKLDASQTWASLRPRLLSLIALSLVIGFGGIAVTLAIVAAIAVSFGAMGGWAIVPALLLTFGGAIALAYAYVRVSMASPALVIEGLSPVEALRRSWHLVGGSWWRVFGILIVSGIITGALAAVVSIPINGIAAAATGFGTSQTASVVASGLSMMLSGLITLPFGAAVTGLLYTDLRIRKEGLAPALISGSTGQAAGQVPGWTGGRADDPLAPYRRAQHPYPPAG